MPNNPLIGPQLHQDLPLYPPTLQLIRVTAATVPGPSGVTQVAASSVLGPTLYVAFVQQMLSTGLIPRDREPCLADDVNGGGLRPGYYLGRLASSHNALPVYEIAEVAGSGGGFLFAKALANDPDGSGHYDARLQTFQADGQLLDNGASVWMREAQNMGRLYNTVIYPVTLTGFAAGRSVYTVADFCLAVGNATLSQLVAFVHLIFCAPDRCWDVTLAGARLVQVKRLLNVRETGGTIFPNIFQITFDPATNWEVDDVDDDGDVIVQRVLNVRDGTTPVTTLTWQMDFSPAESWIITATAAGHATIERTLRIFEGGSQRGTDNVYSITFEDVDFDITATGNVITNIQTSGYTGSFDVITNCVAGVLKVRCLTFIRGLLKTVGAERDLGSSSCP